jgi:hypothetical protein
MTTEHVAGLHYQHFNACQWDAAVELIHAEAVFHTLPTRERPVGVAGYRALVAAWLRAFAAGPAAPPTGRFPRPYAYPLKVTRRGAVLR